jgi:hypothetical protein
MLQTGHQAADGFAREFDDVARAARGADLTDDREDDVLGRHARRQFALDADFHRFGFLLQQRLRGQYVLDFARADAVCQRAEGAVRRRVRVAANDRLARLRDAEFRPDDVNDSGARIGQVEAAHAEFLAVVDQRIDLLG